MLAMQNEQNLAKRERMFTLDNSPILRHTLLNGERDHMDELLQRLSYESSRNERKKESKERSQEQLAQHEPLPEEMHDNEEKQFAESLRHKIAERLNKVALTA